MEIKKLDWTTKKWSKLSPKQQTAWVVDTLDMVIDGMIDLKKEQGKTLDMLLAHIIRSHKK